jgi:outer membrane protein assembly factor BamB
MSTHNNIQNISKILIYICAGFIIVISLLMLLNALQVRTIDPLNTEPVEKLVEKLAADPTDEQLKEQIRAVDLLSRKAYFSSLWQLKTGAYIILGSIILLLISVKVYDYFNKLNYNADEAKPRAWWSIMFKERRILSISVALIAIAALLVSFSSDQYYTDFNSSQFAELNDGDIQINEQTNSEADYFQNFDGSLNLQDSVIEENRYSMAVEESDTTETEDAVKEDDFPSVGAINRYHPGFRGPFGLGISFKKNIPEEWDGPSGKNIIWKKPISLPGLNSPAIWGNYLFLSGANANSQKLYCYNRLTGGLIWAKDVKDIPGHPTTPIKVTNDTGHAAPSVSTDGKRVYVIFATGDVACFNFKGEMLWGKNIGVPDNHYGHSSSLISFKNKLIIQFDHNKSQQIIALNIYTGEEEWKTKHDGRISWASPILIKATSNPEIIVANEPYVTSLDFNTGKVKWKTDCLSGEIGPSPAYENGMIFACNEYAKMVGIRNGSIVWESYDFLPDASSPVAYKGLLFVTTSYGEMACLSQADGSIKWSTEFENGFYGSPMVVEDKVYVVDRSGVTHIVEAKDQLKLIGSFKLGEKSDGTPAFADGRIYIRGKNNLYCIGVE